MEHSAIGCQLRPGTGQQAWCWGNADGYHAKVTGVGAAVGLYLLHEGTAREGAHLLTQIELHALRFQLLLDQLAHLRVKLGQKLLLFFNVRTLRPSLRKDFAISKPAQLPPRITMSRT